MIQLTDLQLAVMKVLWDQGESSVQDVQQALLPERRLALTTVATLLSRLKKRGVVGHRVVGRQFSYRARVTERAARRSAVERLTETLFGGNATALITHLLTSKDVRAGDLDEVKRMIADEERRGGGNDGE